MLVNIKELKVHFDGDEELIGELVEVFETSYPETLTSIKASTVSNNFKDLELHAHTMKGMISNFFSEELKEAAFVLEKMGRDEKSDGFQQYVDILEEGLPKLVAEIKSIL
jgi:protein-histidine pros-kinase